MIHWKELHIGLNQVLDKVESKTIKAFEKEELDWWLNIAQLKLLKNSLVQEVQGQQSSMRRVAKQEELIKRRTLVAYTYNDSRRQYCYLPADYLSHESSASDLDWHCNGLEQKGITATLSYAVLPFPTATGSSPFYVGYSIWLAGLTTLYNLATRPAGLNVGVTDVDLGYIIANDAYDVMQSNSSNIKVYWEHFGSLYHANSFIFVSEATTPPASINWGYVVGTPQATVSFTSLALLKAPTITTKIDLFKPNRILPSAHSHDVMEHPFAKTSYRSPACFIRDGLLEIEIDNTFNVYSVELEYVRVPRRINYLAEQGSELNANMFQELIELTAELMLDTIQDGRRQQVFRQNQVNN